VRTQWFVRDPEGEDSEVGEWRDGEWRPGSMEDGLRELAMLDEPGSVLWGRPAWTGADVERAAQALLRKVTSHPAAWDAEDAVRAVVADTVLLCEGTLRIEDLE